MEPRIGINLLPLLGVVDRVIVIHGVCGRESEALVHASNLVVDIGRVKLISRSNDEGGHSVTHTKSLQEYSEVTPRSKRCDTGSDIHRLLSRLVGCEGVGVRLASIRALVRPGIPECSRWIGGVGKL